MAGDWIKVEKTTPDKPEILYAANKCGVTAQEAFAAWFRLYSWADGVTESGFVPLLSPIDGDKISQCPGLCHALIDAGWIVHDDKTGGITFKNWERHNGKNAKSRANEQEKKRKQRKMSPVCPDSNGTEPGQNQGQKPPKSGTREEKRREDIKESTASSTKENSARRFVPPSVEEVAAYCKERGNGVDPQKWHDHYIAKGWMIGKNRMKDWQAAVRTWEEKKASTEPKNYSLWTEDDIKATGKKI